MHKVCSTGDIIHPRAIQPSLCIARKPSKNRHTRFKYFGILSPESFFALEILESALLGTLAAAFPRHYGAQNLISFIAQQGSEQRPFPTELPGSLRAGHPPQPVAAAPFEGGFLKPPTMSDSSHRRFERFTNLRLFLRYRIRAVRRQVRAGSQPAQPAEQDLMQVGDLSIGLLILLEV